MDPDRKQIDQNSLTSKDDDDFIAEYKEEVLNKPWSKTLKLLVAITTLILAVVGTIASFKAASMGNQVVITQNEAFNHWSNYQAKTIKKTTLETESVSYTHLTLPTILNQCRSRWSPYH